MAYNRVWCSCADVSHSDGLQARYGSGDIGASFEYAVLSMSPERRNLDGALRKT